VEFSWGATEAKVVEGLVDAAVEITETGSTIRAHGLRIVCDLLHTTTRLIANRAALADPWKKAKIEQIALLTRAALAARNKVALKMNVPAAQLDQVVATAAQPARAHRQPSLRPRLAGAGNRGGWWFGA
jgi:ATP phosphoribosyltransferase